MSEIAEILSQLEIADLGTFFILKKGEQILIYYADQERFVGNAFNSEEEAWSYLQKRDWIPKEPLQQAQVVNPTQDFVFRQTDTRQRFIQSMYQTVQEKKEESPQSQQGEERPHSSFNPSAFDRVFSQSRPTTAQTAQPTQPTRRTEHLKKYQFKRKKPRDPFSGFNKVFG